MKNTNNQFRKNAVPSILSVLGLISLMAATPASAAKFGVKIVNESGQAVEGAAVCVGMPGNNKQFGSLVTDESGLAMVEVPAVPFVLTISDDSVGNMQIKEPARRFNLIKQVTLKSGELVPTCKVAGLMKSEPSVKISDVQVTENTYSTSLNPTVVGEPTHFRVSESSSFTGAKWTRFDTSIPLSASLSEQAEIYVQMRRYKGVNKSWIEAKSNVVTVQLSTFE